MSVGQMVLYVTRGIGMEGKGAPRVRFLAPPEIILWEIDGTDNAPPKS
jgi:predicted MPP superfamily phosphohydrolase